MLEEKSNDNSLEDITGKNNDLGLKRPAGKRKTLIIIIVIVILLIGGLIWAITKYQKKNVGPGGGAAIVTADQKQQTAEFIQKIGRHLDLPAKETPQIYVVQNADQLIAQQQFWAGVANGDVAVVYMNARKAIVYSPTRDKIINVGPIYFSDDKAAQATASPAKPVASPTKQPTNKVKTQP